VFEMEVLEALARTTLRFSPVPKVDPTDHRRNLTVRGVPLDHLVGQRFRVGSAVLFDGRLNFPCKYLEKLLGLPVYLPLYNRSGLAAVFEPHENIISSPVAAADRTALRIAGLPRRPGHLLKICSLQPAVAAEF
jgi:hypothetical protein